MVIIKTIDKRTLKSKINYQCNYQSDINTDLSNISNPNNSFSFSFIIWIADIGQVSVNVTLIIALIIHFTFLCTFIHCFYNHHDNQILDYHVQILDFKILCSLKRFSGKRTKYKYFNDFISVVFNFQYKTSYIIIQNQTISPTQYFNQPQYFQKYWFYFIVNKFTFNKSSVY